MNKTTYTVTGMSCAACSARVEKAVSGLPGVTACSVNLLTNTLQIEGNVTEETVKKAVEGAGYGLLPSATEKKAAPARAAASPLAEMRRRFFVSLVLLLLLMLLSMGHRMLGMPLPFGLSESILSVGVLEMLLSTAILFLNRGFFVRGARGALHGAPNMDTLVSLGAAASYGYSLFVLFEMIFAAEAGNAALTHALSHSLYFESAAMILTLVTLGKMLEARAKGKATDAIATLLSLTPDTAVRLRDGEEERVAVEKIVRGDVLVLRPGERVPVDGRVLTGEGAFDESALTGESLPVDKKEGDPLYAATVNRSGHLTFLAEGVGEDTALARIVRMVKEASATKAPMAKLADRVAGVFVPTVLLLALAAFLGWLIGTGSAEAALRYGVSVLVISCPCALGLATPVAIMVGSGKGASVGILFKTATALEYTGRVRTVILDKTGTLTEGRLSVCRMLPAEGVTEERLLSLAAAAEKGSEHPLAAAILTAARERGLALSQVVGFEAHAGYGVSASVEEKRLLCGKETFVSCPLPDGLRETVRAEARTGKTPVFVSADGAYLGCILLSDTVKPDAAVAVKRLHEMKIETLLLTGDRRETACALAESLGIAKVVAEVLPEGKEAAVVEEQRESRVMMVGDGINDAIALTRADVGVAIGAGTDVAVDAADVVLTGSRLSDLPAAIALSRATVRNMKQNLFWAFFYNCLGIPLAAGALAFAGVSLDPMVAAAAMSLSSVTVVSNALRLRFFDPYKTNKTENEDKEEKKEKKEKKMTVTLRIEGMMCPHCSARVQGALEGLASVASALVKHETGEALVTLKEEAPLSLLTEAVEKAGYRVTGAE